MMSTNAECSWCTVCAVPTFWITTDHITAVFITPQTLNCFNIHYFIISYFYSILLYIIIQKWNFNLNYIFLILRNYGEIFNYNCILSTKRPTSFAYSYVFILKFALYIFRKVHRSSSAVYVSLYIQLFVHIRLT